MLAAAIWAGANALEYLAPDIPTAIFWAKLEYLGIASVGPLWFWFARAYREDERPRSHRAAVGVLWLLPVITVVVAATNEQHGWLWSQVAANPTRPTGPPIFHHGPWFWVVVAYTYGLMLVGAIVLLRPLIRVPNLYRRQTADLLLAIAVPWIGNAVYLAGWGPTGSDLTPFAFTLSGAILAWSMFRRRLLDVVPVARHRLVEQMPDAVLVLDPRDRIADINPAAEGLFALAAAGVIGQPLHTVLPEQPALSAGGVAPGNITIRMQTGELRYLDLRSSSIHDHHERCIGRLLVLRDITDHVEAERALRESQEQLERAKDIAETASRAKGEFLATMSHEIRTPMNGVVGMTDLLLGTELSAEQRDYARIVHDSAQGLLTIINDILDFSKIEAGKLTLEETVFEPHGLVAGAVEVLQATAWQKHISLRASVAPEVAPLLRGDPYRLRQVLLNLLSNAVKFTHQGEVVLEVSVESTYETQARVRFTVRDTGIGLSDTAREQLFAPFTQADGSTTRKYGGTGLGLTIAQRLVELMGGTIDVASMPGQGSAFWFTIPLIVGDRGWGLGDGDQVVATTEARTVEDGATTEGLPLHDKRRPVDIGAAHLSPPSVPQPLSPNPQPLFPILVAEDNPVNQKLALIQLRKLGYEAAAVSNGREAVAAVASGRYSLALMDCQMPELDGFAATTAIRQSEARQPGGRRLPIIAMTANAMEGDREACLAAGMDDYLTKPVKVNDLRAILEQWLPASTDRPAAESVESGAQVGVVE